MHSRGSQRDERTHPRPCLKKLPKVELENVGVSTRTVSLRNDVHHAILLYINSFSKTFSTG